MATNKTNTKERNKNDDENLVDYPGRDQLTSSIQSPKEQHSNKEDKSKKKKK